MFFGIVPTHLVDLASGDVVQLVRTLPCHSIQGISIVFSVSCGGSHPRRTVTKLISFLILYYLYCLASQSPVHRHNFIAARPDNHNDPCCS